MKKIIVIAGGLLAGIALGLGSYLWLRPAPPQQITVSTQVQDLLPPPTAPKPSPTPEEKPKPPTEPALEIPGSKQIDVPFIVQAPSGNWEPPYNEACEEASVLMVHHFYKGTKFLTDEQMKTDIDAVTEWGLKTLNAVDTSAADTALYFVNDLGYDRSRVFVRYDFTLDDLKAVLAQGYPVIVPAAGRELENKYFRIPGPLYHMLVITGYDRNVFITNDPGTRHGAGFVYDQTLLYDAIHDLTPDIENIHDGRKAMIVVKPL